MEIDEHIFIKKPKTVLCGPARSEGAWSRRAVSMAVWKLRCNLIRQYGADIFQVVETPDGIEMTIQGDLVASRADMDDENLLRREYRKGRKMLRQKQ